MISIWKLKMMFYFVLTYCKSELENIALNNVENDNPKLEYDKKLRMYKELQKKLDMLIELRCAGELSSDSFISKSKELDESLKNLEFELKTYSKLNLENKTISNDEFSSFIHNIKANTPSDNFLEDNEVEKYISKIKVSKDRIVWCLNISPKPLEQLIASFTISAEEVRKYFKLVDGKEYTKRRIKDYEIFIEI
jgi:hypothetical protein